MKSVHAEPDLILVNLKKGCTFFKINYGLIIGNTDMIQKVCNKNLQSQTESGIPKSLEKR